MKIVNRVANRETTSHYFNHPADDKDQYYTGRSEASNQDYLALITGYDKNNKMLIMREKNYFNVGDEVEIFTPKGDVYSLVIDKIYDVNIIDKKEFDTKYHGIQYSIALIEK